MTEKPPVQNIMRNPYAFSVRPDTPLKDAWNIMRSRAIHHLLVVDDTSNLRGLVSDRELFHQAWDKDGNFFASSTPVSHVMRNSLPIATPDTSVGEALALMTEHELTALPVCLTPTTWGIVTEKDFLRYLAISSQNITGTDVLLHATDPLLANPLVQSLMKLLSDMGV